jgi:hypothetical protein
MAIAITRFTTVGAYKVKCIEERAKYDDHVGEGLEKRAWVVLGEEGWSMDDEKYEGVALQAGVE